MTRNRIPKWRPEDQEELPDVPVEDWMQAYDIVRPGEDVRAALLRVELAALDRDFWHHLAPAARAACEGGRLAWIVVAFCRDSWWACREN